LIRTLEKGSVKLAFQGARKMTRKVILTNFQSPGDLVMLTAAVRDLHLCYPGEFLTDVRTSCPDLWLHNPYLTPLEKGDDGVEVVECHYPLIHQSNQRPYHFIHGFIEYLGERLRTRILPLHFKGDIHLSEEEKNAFPSCAAALGDRPFWIIVAGGKHDFTIKWWSAERFQAVVDHFRGRIQFVQVGSDEHHHPPLEGVVDLRGKTSIRDLVRLIHHSQGVLCPVTLAMHLAAAVETRGSAAPNRPCVVVAGGREPPQWEAYPFHQFLHTVGMLECCSEGGCWRSRVVPLGDGDLKDHPHALCLNPVGSLARCMDMISADSVIRAIEGYFEGGRLSYLS
jgi:ADP-heptose:LPS heptosyltransferase